MDIEQQIQVSNKKKELEKFREQKLKKKLTELNKRKIVQDKSQKHKPAHFLKTKKIQKKEFKTIHEKVKKPEILLQQNVNANTFINQSQNYLKFLNRTKQIIRFDDNKLKNGCEMIKAYSAQNSKQKDMYLEIIFQNELNCIFRPIQISIPHITNTNSKIYFITEFGKKKEEEFEEIKHLNVQIVSLKDFMQKYRNNVTKKQILKSSTKLFCDFKIFVKIQGHRLYKDITKKKVIFPIENGKVPSLLRSKYANYVDYIEDLNKYCYFLTKSQKQYLINICNLRELTLKQMIQDIKVATPQIVARLLQKNKNKHNRVQKILIKSNTSIPIQIYSKVTKPE